MSRFSGRRPRLVEILSRSERVVYYGAAFALMFTVVMIFVSVGISIVKAFDAESLEASLIETSLTVLDRVLLIFIFVELLNTIGIVVREREIVAEPFLLIGLGVLTGLVIALAGALYFTRRAERTPDVGGEGLSTPRPD